MTAVQGNTKDMDDVGAASALAAGNRGRAAAEGNPFKALWQAFYRHARKGKTTYDTPFTREIQSLLRRMADAQRDKLVLQPDFGVFFKTAVEAADHHRNEDLVECFHGLQGGTESEGGSCWFSWYVSTDRDELELDEGHIDHSYRGPGQPFSDTYARRVQIGQQPAMLITRMGGLDI